MDVPALLRWYRGSRRPMPWREEVSPYRTLLSEVMLQQTRVETVIPYFEGFLRAFPTVEALAAAPLEAVLARWSGLGYYRRARMLHGTAQAIVARGGFPDTAEGLRELPGVGPYTAGAVASIAFGRDAALVDGNVARVLCRHDALEEDPRRAERKLWDRARELLPAGQASDFNQALMELGATICTPRSPRCGGCPVEASCRGRAEPARYPAPAPKAAAREEARTALVLRHDGAVLLERTPGEGLLGGLWTPPLGEGSPEALAGSLGLALLGSTPMGTVVHVFTHRRWAVSVHLGTLAPPVPALDVARELRWVPLAEVSGMALSTLARKILRAGGEQVPRAVPRARNPTAVDPPRV